jgi:hypothetical protein
MNSGEAGKISSFLGGVNSQVFPVLGDYESFVLGEILDAA